MRKGKKAPGFLLAIVAVPSASPIGGQFMDTADRNNNVNYCLSAGRNEGVPFYCSPVEGFRLNQ